MEPYEGRQNLSVSEQRILEHRRRVARFQTVKRISVQSQWPPNTVDHQERYKVSVEEASKVLQRWRTWIVTHDLIPRKENFHRFGFGDSK